MASLRRMAAAPGAALAAERGHLFPFVPVFLGIGIALWFALPAEPGPRLYAGAGATCLAALALRLLGPEGAHPLAAALGCVALGLLLAGARAHLQAAPILGFRYYGPVEGRVIEIDRSQSDHLRLTLDRVVLARIPPERTPARVRISLHGEQHVLRPAPGLVVVTTAHLAAPQGAAEPGGFDFQRMAFFQRLGAVGYTRNPVLALAPPEPGTQFVNRMRAHLSATVQAAIPGQARAYAAGAVTGDRAGITQQTVEDLRDSNLAHLLAISGMNMAFLVTFVFALLRYGLALVPWLALRVNGKKLAAVAAFGVAAFYYALSGGNVATERAFIMVTVMLGAVLCDRRALSMRSVALSAVALLATRPESLLLPGFQMSFAATIALIWGFAALQGRIMTDRLPRWTMPAYLAVLSSVLAGIATAPFAAAHFNRFTDYGLLANLLTVPAMGVFVMPGAVVASLLGPFGLAAPGMWLMEVGSLWILTVAAWVAGLEGAVTGIPVPEAAVLPVLTLGALWLVLWRGRARLLGLAPVALALALWTAGERPPLLVSGDGALVGLMGPEGRAFSTPRGAGFAARNWLENDGDLAAQAAAAERAGFTGPASARRFTLGGMQAVQLRGRGAEAALPGACEGGAALVILAASLTGPVPEGCIVIDRTALARSGALAIWPRPGGGFRVQPTWEADRIWTAPVPRDVREARLPEVLLAGN